MKREIEFRGYCDYKKQWEYGGFAKIGDEVFIVAKCDFFRVTPETIGQFTGLHDKNGNKIFDGDILANGTGRLCKVFWNECHGCWDAMVVKTVSGDSSYCGKPYDWGKGMEIIGNIFDNPELIGG